ncbi:ankyrin repeat domain-containing protein 17 [Quercus suber]|uniref:Ankyrin repeat domain-containing protein 17 n=1 Tax=Quercus suber TaxID=58331 RepID=A0AAW0LTR2_QUESU
MTRIQRIITKQKETTLHIAAAANQEKFVRNLLRTMIYDNPCENLTAVNEIGNTALTYAAATGNVNIAMAMLDINSDLPNLHSGVKPLYMAASLGHRKMVQLLYSKTKEVVREWEEDEQDDLFITCVEGDLYGVALEMLEVNPNIATATNKDGETVLQLLARNPSAFVGETQPCELF